MKRDDMLRRATERSDPWDMVIIGGGATGAGIAVDAASRGYSVLLLERFDFGKGTSSRSTKLVHGGVRYLEQGNITLVMEALRERGRLLRNAPHLVHDLPFVVPTYSWWESPFYGIGLKVYDMLAGKYRFGKSQILSRAETLERLPNIKTDGLRGGIIYHDGQFDDSRLLIHLLATAVDHGAVVLNYAPVEEILQQDGVISGVIFVDSESEEGFEANARVVVNATGVFCDEVRRMTDPAAKTMIAPSQGAHLVFDKSFLPGDSAIMVPHTSDGRVMFAIPWHGHTLVGTTDVGLKDASIEPRATDAEIDFILDTASRYLARTPTRADILSVFAGIRPLVNASGGNTASLSREHAIQIEKSGLLTIVGGKWTTYRAMAQDCVDQATVLGDLPERPCRTKRLPIHGYLENAVEFGDLAAYGSDAAPIRNLQLNDTAMAVQLHPALPYTAAEVVWAARKEMARSVEDVLARRTRALFLNSQAAIEMAPQVADLLANELCRSPAWVAESTAAFLTLAAGYRI